LDAVVLETDSPDMAPAMFPGERNSPAHLPAICEALAGIMTVTPERLAEASTANARQLFQW
jgi:TatD DNase family protein